MKIELTKIIREGEQVPFWYGIVGVRLDYLDSVEVGIIPFNFLKRFWHWTLKSSQIPKWQKTFIDREAEVKRKAFEHGVSVGLKQARHQPEMKAIYKDVARAGMGEGLEVFKIMRHSTDGDIKKWFDDKAQEIADRVA